jgi:glucose-1-phosphate cytidylyltransferase
LATPKALLEIGGQPLIWHLCKSFAHYGLNDFILCLGFLSERFSDYFEQPVIDVGDTGSSQASSGPIARKENWSVALIDTGLDTNTGGRLKKVQPLLSNERTFCVTYGDGLADVAIDRLVAFHSSHQRTGTLTAVNPFSTFGLLDLSEDGLVVSFREKPRLSEWINGGFFVFEQGIFDYLDEDPVLEREPFEKLSRDNQLMAFRHHGFWKCMDTFKDNVELNELWNAKAPWKVW